MKLHRLGVFLVIGSLLVGCGGSDKGASTPNADQYLLLPDGLTVDPSQLDSEELSLFSRIQRHEEIRFSELTRLLVREEAKSLVGGDESQVQEKVEVLERALSEIETGVRSQGVNAGSSLLEIKKAYETYFESAREKSLVFNREAKNLSDLVLDGKLQARSSSLFLEILRRRIGGRLAYEKRDPVLIYLPGHVMAGEVRGGSVIGVDLVNRADVEINLGTLIELESLPIRVVRADLWAVGMVFRHGMVRPGTYVNRVWRETGSKYGFQWGASSESVNRFLLTAVTSELKSEVALSSEGLFEIGNWSLASEAGDLVRKRVFDPSLELLMKDGLRDYLEPTLDHN